MRRCGNNKTLGRPRMLPLVALAVAGLAMSGCASTSRGSSAKVLSIDSIRLTAAGHYVDLRYRVLDPARASEVLGPKVKPVLIDEATGRKMEVPMTAKLGSLRQTNGIQKPNRTYFVLFANTAPIRPGSHVTAELGDLRFEHLTVQTD
jgi:hypothetical protein